MQREFLTSTIVMRRSSATKPVPHEETVAPIDPDDDDPDVFVLGFQELDLSTEALIYSLGTAREDAWVRATFASLGEKAEKYEKVSSYCIMKSPWLNAAVAGIEATCRDAHSRHREEDIEGVLYRC
jgi:phosphatidylinositol-bisphosphatase